MGIEVHQLTLVLLAVKLLNDQLLRCSSVLHARYVGVLRVAGNVHPLGFGRDYLHHANAVGRGRLAHFGILDGNVEGIDGIRIVDHQEVADFSGIELPVRNRLAVGAPPKTVTAVEFFFIDPVEGTVDNPVRAVLRQGFGLARFQVIHVNIVFAHVGHFLAVGRNLGKHQRRLGTVLTNLGQVVVGQIEQPIVAPRIIAPYPLRVGVN